MNTAYFLATNELFWTIVSACFAMGLGIYLENHHLRKKIAPLLAKQQVLQPPVSSPFALLDITEVSALLSLMRYVCTSGSWGTWSDTATVADQTYVKPERMAAALHRLSVFGLVKERIGQSGMEYRLDSQYLLNELYKLNQ